MGQQAALDKKAVDLIHGFHRGDSQRGGPDGLGREPFLQCGDNQAVASITDIQKALFEGAFSFAPGGTEEVCGLSPARESRRTATAEACFGPSSTTRLRPFCARRYHYTRQSNSTRCRRTASSRS